MGVLLTLGTLSIQPLSVFLPVSAGGGDSTSAIVVYLTIPLVIGTITGYLERESPWVNGLSSGLVSGIVNLFASQGELYRINLPSNLQAQFNLFVLMLTLLWGLLAAFSAKFAVWSLE